MALLIGFFFNTSPYVLIESQLCSLVRLIIADVSQCFRYKLHQFPNTLQRYSLKKILMLQFLNCSYNAQLLLYIQAFMLKSYKCDKEGMRWDWNSGEDGNLWTYLCYEHRSVALIIIITPTSALLNKRKIWIEDKIAPTTLRSILWLTCKNIFVTYQYMAIS